MEEDKPNSFRGCKCTNWSFQLYSHQVLIPNTVDKLVNNAISFHIIFFFFSRSKSDSYVQLMPLSKAHHPFYNYNPTPLNQGSSLYSPLPFFKRKPLHLLDAFILILQSRTIFLNLQRLTIAQSHKANECGFTLSYVACFFFLLKNL